MQQTVFEISEICNCNELVEHERKTKEKLGDSNKCIWRFFASLSVLHLVNPPPFNLNFELFLLAMSVVFRALFTFFAPHLFHSLISRTVLQSKMSRQNELYCDQKTDMMPGPVFEDPGFICLLGPGEEPKWLHYWDILEHRPAWLLGRVTLVLLLTSRQEWVFVLMLK
jgi:hypothetical protein